MDKRLTVLLIDAPEQEGHALAKIIEPGRAEIVRAEDVHQAWTMMEQGIVPNLVFAFAPSADDGLAFLNRVRGRTPQCVRVLMAQDAPLKSVSQAINTHQIHRFIQTPASADELGQVFEYSLEVLRREESEELRVAERTKLLEQIKKTWERTFDVVGSPLAIVTDDFTIERANLAYAEASEEDIRSIPGQHCYSVFFDRDSPCEDCPMVVSRQEQEPAQAQLVQEQKERMYHSAAYHFDLDGGAEESNRYVLLYDDVTERKRIERQLIQSEKMVALGTLSGEIAHEINNPVGIILSFSQLALRSKELEQIPDLHEFLFEIQKSARRCKSIIRNLLSFSRPSTTANLQAVQFKDVIEKTVEIAAAQIRTQRVAVSVSIGEKLPQVYGHADQFQQVFLNLLTNAVHAMESVEQRAVSITVTAGRLEERPAVQVEIQDSGTGIPEDKLSQVFEPFFTTKEEGKGTGLGLSICYRIIRQHGGIIEVDNAESGGARFKILIPGVEVSA